MKIAVSGKGGSGKTIISATLARSFAAQGHHVLAIDDDHDPNLAVSLGVPRETDVPSPPDDVVERVETDDDGASWELTTTPRTIVDEYGVKAPDGVTLLRPGAVESGGEGAFGYSHITALQLFASSAESDEEVFGENSGDTEASEDSEDNEAGKNSEVNDVGENDEIDADVTIADLPAGLGVPGLAKPADVLLMIVEPSYNSLETIRKLNDFALEYEVPDVRVIANDVRTDQDLEFIEEHCMDLGLEVSMVVPHDDAVSHAEQNGLAPVDYGDESPAISVISELAQDLEAEI